MKALLIDFDDSFTYNLRHWLSPLCSEVVVRNHRDLSQLPETRLVVLSPGPLHPNNYPHAQTLLQKLPAETFVFGVCLGLQLMVASEGGLVESYSPPLHGKKSKLASRLPVNGMEVARYHSLKCVPTGDFETLATAADDGVPMWLKHKSKNWMGVQFHPESFLTANSEEHLKALSQWVKQ
jgi:anthranilate/para-aminobenzoate synthase component II